MVKQNFDQTSLIKYILGGEQVGAMLIHSRFIWNGEHLFGKQSVHKSRHL